MPYPLAKNRAHPPDTGAEHKYSALRAACLSKQHALANQPRQMNRKQVPESLVPESRQRLKESDEDYRKLETRRHSRSRANGTTITYWQPLQSFRYIPAID